MPLHRKKSGSQKSINFSGSNQSYFVNENHHFTWERSTVMTIASSSNAIKTPCLEFVFKGKGTRVKVNPPEQATPQWSDKDSYRVSSTCFKVHWIIADNSYSFCPRKMLYFSSWWLFSSSCPRSGRSFFEKGIPFDYYWRKNYWWHTGEWYIISQASQSNMS